MEIWIVYAVVLAFVVGQWGYNRVQLARGLAINFHKMRTAPWFSKFLEKRFKAYLVVLVFLVLQICLVWFCGYRILHIFGLWGVESGVVLSIITLFLTKDRVFYETALFVVTKRIEG